MEKKSFSTIDYVVFVGFLAASTVLGLFFAVWPLLRGKGLTTKDLMLGNKSPPRLSHPRSPSQVLRQMSIIPVALTLVATFVSAISLLGYGAMYCIAYPIAAYVYLPVFYKLGLTSAYQYLEMRFSKAVRLSASGLFCVLVFAYMAVVLYAPALALSVVTTLSLEASILTTGILATLYTSLGGAKAVMWTNTAQMLIILVGMVWVVAKGSAAHGGIAAVWAIADSGHRIQFNDFRVDPRVRHSFWSLVVGGTVTILTLMAANQMTIQRYVSMPSLRKAQTAVLLNIPVNLATITLYMLCGLILYAEYANCDPVRAGTLLKFDELLPYYVMEKLSSASGLPGLFVAALYSAGLSTLSGGLNAVASIIYVDFVRPLYHSCAHSELSDNAGTRILKIIPLVFGVAVIGMAFGFTHLSSSVLQIALSIFGMVGGPLLGAFTLGMGCPWANGWGALAGLWTGFGVAAWLGLGAVAHGIRKVNLPLGTDCSNGSTSPHTFPPLPHNYNRVYASNESSGGLIEWHSISYQYYALVAFLVQILVGVVVSGLTGWEEAGKLDSRLLFPLERWLPGPLRRRLPEAGPALGPPLAPALEEDGEAERAPALPAEKIPFIDA